MWRNFSRFLAHSGEMAEELRSLLPILQLSRQIQKVDRSITKSRAVYRRAKNVSLGRTLPASLARIDKPPNEWAPRIPSPPSNAGDCPRVRVGAPGTTQPYSASGFQNISANGFRGAWRARDRGACRPGERRVAFTTTPARRFRSRTCRHTTGRGWSDLVWENRVRLFRLPARRWARLTRRFEDVAKDRSQDDRK